MKRILYILLLLVLNFTLKAQVTPIGTGQPLTQNISSDSAFLNMKGVSGGKLVLYRFTDTTAANNSGRFKNYPFALIGTTSDDQIWRRNAVATAWTGMAAGDIGFDSIFVLNDSTWIFCTSSGSCDTIAFNNNNVFLTVNNAFGGCNNLLSGGVVTANNPTVNLVFDVTAADYTIGCKAYHTDIDQVTLVDGDASFGRFDVIAVDTNEAVIVIQGTPSSDPQVPQINSASQLALTTILVPAGATTATQLGITQTVIYDENLQVAGGEWDSSGVSWTRDFANTSFPAHLTKDLLLSGSTVSGSQIQWTTTDTMRNGQFDVFKFYIRLTDAWVAGQGLDISFYNGTTKVSNSITFTNNSYGFDQTVTGSYQTIAIPMANWVFSDSIFFSVVFKPLATPFSSQAFRLDWVQLQGGINQALGGSSGLYIWNQYSLAQPANYWIAGSAKIQGGITSPNINYVLSEQYGYNSSVTAIAGTALGAYSRVSGSTGTALGDESVSTGGLAVGYYARSGGSTNISIGGNTSSATSSNLLGRDGVISGTQSNGIGQNVTVTHNNTTAIGYFATSTRNNEFMLGSEYTSLEMRGVSRGVAGYVLTDSLGDGSYWVARPSTGSLSAANNGTSVSGTTVQLGQAEAAVGNPAILLSNREIPMANFYLSLNASAAQSNNIFQTKNSSAAVRARITSAASFSNTGGQTGAEIFGDGASASGSNVVAVGNTASGGGSANTVIGTSAAGGSSGGNVAIGQAATISDGITGITLIGTASSASTSGNQTLVGSGITSTGRSTGVGTGGTFSSTNNFGFGEQVNVSHTYSGALGFGATTTAANQLVIGANVNGGTEGAINDIYWGNGITTPSPDDVSLNANSGSGTDIAGSNIYYNASRATGNAATGVHIFQTSTVGASGTTIQTLAPKIQINGSGILSYDGVLPTSGSGGTDSVIARNSSTGQWYLTTVAAGSGLTTADNGLTANTATNVQHGSATQGSANSPLLHDTYLNTDTYRYTISGDKDRMLWVESASGRTAYFAGNDGNYVMNIINVSTGGGLLVSAGGGGLGGIFTSLSTTTNTAVPILELEGQSTGTTASGFGSSIRFTNQTTTSTGQLSNELKSTFSTTTHATRTSQFIITGVNNATTATLLTLDGNGLMTLGVAGTNKGSLAFAGNTSGTITIQPAAAAGTYTLTLPTDDGTPNQFLQTDGSGVLTWATASGTGDVTKVGTPVNNQIGVWTGDGTIEGDANLTFASSTLNIGVAGASTGIFTLSGVTSGTITIQPASAAGTYTLTLPTTDGAPNEFLQTDGSGVLTWAAGGGAVSWNSITDPTGAQALTFQAAENSVWTDQNTTADNLTINSSTGTTNSLISLNRTGTALASGNNIMELVSSGANGTNAITATGLLISVTNTNATSGTNNAITLTASGATTANNAINITAGSIQAISGSATQRSMDMGNVGIFNAGGTDLGIFAGTIERTRVGQSGFQVRDGTTSIIDMGSVNLGGTNSWRLTGGTVGTLKVATVGATAAVGVEASGGEGANAFLNLYKDEGDDNDDKWSLTSSVSANALIFANNATEGFRFSTVAGTWSIRNVEKQGADVASAVGAIALGTDGNAFEITGTSAITLISNVNFQNGAVVTLIFTSTASLTDGTANSGTDIGMELAGNTNFTGSAGATLTLRLLEVGSVQRWYEVARSVQ